MTNEYLHEELFDFLYMERPSSAIEAWCHHENDCSELLTTLNSSDI